MLVSKNAKICVTPNANRQSEQVEYRSHLVPNAKFLVGQVDFMLFVSLSLVLGSQREHTVQWNMGYRVCPRSPESNLTGVMVDNNSSHGSGQVCLLSACQPAQRGLLGQ